VFPDSNEESQRTTPEVPAEKIPVENPLKVQWTPNKILVAVLAGLMLTFGIYFVVSFNRAKLAALVREGTSEGTAS